MVIFEAVALPQPVTVRGRGKNKKFWNSKEEATLVDILYELNGTSWKTDNGYKNGYCYFIEQRMEEKLPGCGVKADPHIESKLKILKKHLAYILAMDDNDEFWWDDEQKMVVGDKEAYLSWAKNHEGASTLFMKPFVHFDKLCEIYGKKRSTQKRMRVTPQAIAFDSPIAHITNVETQSNTREEVTSITQSTITPPSSETGNEKPKRSREVDLSDMEFLEMSKTIRSLAEAQKDLTSTLMNMRKVSTHDVEISEQRKKLFSVLSTLPGLSPIEVVKAARSIGQDDRKVEVFFSMPDDYKVIFAHLEINSSD